MTQKNEQLVNGPEELKGNLQSWVDQSQRLYEYALASPEGSKNYPEWFEDNDIREPVHSAMQAFKNGNFDISDVSTYFVAYDLQCRASHRISGNKTSDALELMSSEFGGIGVETIGLALRAEEGSGPLSDGLIDSLEKKINSNTKKK